MKLWNDAKRVNENETNSSGFASGATEPGSGESVSTAHDSDVSSSLQSPSSNVEIDNATQDVSAKKRRMSDDSEATAVEIDVEKLAKCNNDNPDLMKEGTSECENGPPQQVDADPMQIDENEHENDELDGESEADMEDGDDKEKRALKEKAKQAEGFWMNYIRDNNTVIASSFQGMYKSTVCYIPVSSFGIVTNIRVHVIVQL